MSEVDLSNASMLDLFRIEVETQAQVMVGGLLTLEHTGNAPRELESCMRAAHSLKGAARIVGIPAGVDLAHEMEDCFVAAQKGEYALSKAQIDVLLPSVDLFSDIARTAEADLARWSGEWRTRVDDLIAALRATRANGDARAAPSSVEAQLVKAAPAPQPAADSPPKQDVETGGVLRVAADNLDRMLGFTSELLVESRRLKPFASSLFRLKKMQHTVVQMVDRLRDALAATGDGGHPAVTEISRHLLQCQQLLGQRLEELELIDGSTTSLAQRLYEEALACRMRPFADGIVGLPRMARDVAHALHKDVRLEIEGKSTQVDRDILERLDAPLRHLLRNAIDHGIEPPDTRRAAGKPSQGIVRLEARHSAGQLQVSVVDDGRGIDIEHVRTSVISRGLINAETAAKLSQNELFEFLFLPGFTTASGVTEISGRGVGLDAVQAMVKEVHGTVRVSSQVGIGTRFQLHLPLTLSVVRTLTVEIAQEVYAIPLASILRTVKIRRASIAFLEGRQHVVCDGRHVGLVSAHQVLDLGEPPDTETLSVVVIGEKGSVYGLVVDAFLGEHELVVQQLDPRLGKIKDVAAAAVMADGSPLLIVDVRDLLRSAEKLAQSGRLNRVGEGTSRDAAATRKRILVVDDSLTVRELERKLLNGRGYEVEVEVDGMAGWNAVRLGKYDLLVTDVDMPRMDGIELVSMVRADPKLKSLPVMIVSYKDREEDRARGLEAGADYYLTKGSFHDESLLQAVADLIGGPDA